MTDTSQTALIYDRLRQGILNLDMAPGMRLTERSLETTLEASRTPVRAALMRLESEGLVQRDGRGWMVAPIDLAEVRSLLELREIIESASARLAVERASVDDIDALEDLLLSFDARESSEAGLRSGTDFHVELVRLSGNGFLVASTESSLTRLARTRWLVVRTPESRETALTEHRAIVGALRRRDSDDAAERVVAHIHSTRDGLVESLDADRQRLRAHGVAIV